MNTETKVCTSCKVEKTRSEFGVESRNKDGLNNRCKECFKKYRTSPEYIKRDVENKKKYRSDPENRQKEKQYRQKYRSNPENRQREKVLHSTPEYRDNRKKYYQKCRLITEKKNRIKLLSTARTYSISILQVQQLKSELFCRICKKPFCGRTPHLDHCHTTGKVRGTLCQKCNSTLGYALDDPFTLLRAAHYVAHEGDMTKFEEL